MHFNEDSHSWLASYGELQSLTGLLGITTNPLGIITGQSTSSDPAAKEDWHKLEPFQQEALRTILTTLAGPRQIIHLAWTVGDFFHQRATLSRQSGEKEAVWLSQQEGQDLYQLQMAATDEIILLLNDILKSSSLNDDNNNHTLSSTAVITLLGITELMRQRYHQSMLYHQAANQVLNAEQVQSILKAAVRVDYRWPLCFWEKNLPLDINNLLGKIPAGLQELKNAGWLLSSSPGIFEFTDQAMYLTEEMLNEQTKVSLTIAAADGQEIAIQDSILLVRGPQSLWLYYVGGDQGGVGQVGSSGWSALSQALLKAPEPVPEMPPVSAAAPAQDIRRFCPQCGAGIIPEGKFCGSCGQEL